jgi:hypothetical protein
MTVISLSLRQGCGIAPLFRRYWRVIYPGSSLIRTIWLRAIKKGWRL